MNSHKDLGYLQSIRYDREVQNSGLNRCLKYVFRYTLR